MVAKKETPLVKLLMLLLLYSGISEVPAGFSSASAWGYRDRGPGGGSYHPRIHSYAGVRFRSLLPMWSDSSRTHSFSGSESRFLVKTRPRGGRRPLPSSCGITVLVESKPTPWPRPWTCRGVRDRRAGWDTPRISKKVRTSSWSPSADTPPRRSVVLPHSQPESMGAEQAGEGV